MNDIVAFFVGDGGHDKSISYGVAGAHMIRTYTEHWLCRTFKSGKISDLSHAPSAASFQGYRSKRM